MESVGTSVCPIDKRHEGAHEGHEAVVVQQRAKSATA
jgi:hypothetical protein